MDTVSMCEEVLSGRLGAWIRAQSEEMIGFSAVPGLSGDEMVYGAGVLLVSPEMLKRIDWCIFLERSGIRGSVGGAAAN